MPVLLKKTVRFFEKIFIDEKYAEAQTKRLREQYPHWFTEK